MKILSALDIHYLIQELQFLINSRVDKIYAPRKKELFIQLFASGKGKFTLHIDEKSIYLTEQKPSSVQPSQFCMYLRKKLDNSRLRNIRQIGFERILSFDFETKAGTISLVSELFSKGNLILLKDNKILTASEYQNWKDRTIRPNIIYKHPEKEYDFLKLTQANFKKLLSTTNKENIVKTLAIELGLGGVYSEEACLLSDIDKNKKAKDLTEKEISSLSKALEKLRSMPLSPKIVYKNNEIHDLTPFELKFYEKQKQDSSKSYNEILNNYFSKFSVIKQKEKQLKQVKEIQAIIQKQRQDIKKLETQELDSQKKAEKLYENYKLVSEILKELQKISKSHPWKEIQEKLKGNSMIKEVIPKDKSIVLELK